MTRSVRFKCTECDFVHHVPEAHVVLVGGLAHSDYVQFHECPNGGTLEERSIQDMELLTTTPGYNIRVKL